MRQLALGVVIAAFVVCCSILYAWRMAPPDASAQPAGIQADGFWQLVGAEKDTAAESKHQWFAIATNAPHAARVVWENQGFCSQTEGFVAGRELHVRHQDASITFDFNSTIATVTFRQGAETWFQQYEKIRGDAPPCDWLLH